MSETNVSDRVVSSLWADRNEKLLIGIPAIDADCPDCGPTAAVMAYEAERSKTARWRCGSCGSLAVTLWEDNT